MSFFGKIASLFGKVESVVNNAKPLIPYLVPLIPGGAMVQDIFDGVDMVTNNVEAIFQAFSGPGKGADKLAAATPQVAALILQSKFMLDKKVVDQAGFIDGCKQLVSAMVKIKNSMDPLSQSEIAQNVANAREVAMGGPGGQIGAGTAQRLIQ